MGKNGTKLKMKKTKSITPGMVMILRNDSENKD